MPQTEPPLPEDEPVKPGQEGKVPPQPKPPKSDGSKGADTVTVPAGAPYKHDWVVPLLALIFTTTYLLAAFGVIAGAVESPLADRIEPILFAIVAYYFGRLPSRQLKHTMDSQIAEQNVQINEAEEARRDAQDSAVQARAESSELLARQRVARDLIEQAEATEAGDPGGGTASMAALRSALQDPPWANAR